MLKVAHHGVAAAQLGGPSVALVVVADAAVPHHGQDEGEDPLVDAGEKKPPQIYVFFPAGVCVCVM